MATRHSSALPELVEQRHILGPVLKLDSRKNPFESLPKWPKSLSKFNNEQRKDILVRVESILLPLKSDLVIYRAVRDSLIAGYSHRNTLDPEYVSGFSETIALHAPRVQQSAQLGFALIGPSGSGKTTAIRRALEVAVPDQPVPFNDGAPPGAVGLRVGYLYFECPSSVSRSGIVNAFFHVLSETLHNQSIADKADASHDSIEQGIHEMADKIRCNDIGILVIDEIERIFHPHKGSEDAQLVMNFLTSLVNSLGIPIAFVGTPDLVPYLEAERYLERRSKGMGMITIGALSDWEFRNFIDRISQYQVTPSRVAIDDAMYDAFDRTTGRFPGSIIQLWRRAQGDALDYELPCVTPASIETSYRKWFAPSQTDSAEHAASAPHAADTPSSASQQADATASTPGTGATGRSWTASHTAGSPRPHRCKATRTNMEQVAQTLMKHKVSRADALAIAERAVDAAEFGASVSDITYEALAILVREQTSS
jgi:hypothetical protein